MVYDDLPSLTERSLPEGLSLRPVRRLREEPADGVPLIDAVQAAARAAAPGDVIADELTAYLASLPQSRVFAAVDAEGVVRGTSASRVSMHDAYVFFVNTDPEWRHRGVGSSMTTTALRAAATAGATRASLDASGPGVALYRRLGFSVAAELTQFSWTG